jgi:hypothetical protein
MYWLVQAPIDQMQGRVPRLDDITRQRGYHELFHRHASFLEMGGIDGFGVMVHLHPICKIFGISSQH